MNSVPMYYYKHKDTGEVTEHLVRYSELEEFAAQNPDLQQLPSKPAMVDPVTAGRIRHDNGFNDLLKETKKHHPGASGINVR